MAWILEQVPATRDNYIMLLLTYWTVFDDINIPSDILQQILTAGTEPETINRSRRKIVELRRQLTNIREEIDELWQQGKKKSE